MMNMVEKVAECPTCESSKHLLNMLEGSDRVEALSLMMNDDEKYTLDGNTLKKKSDNEWLPIGDVVGSTGGITDIYFMGSAYVLTKEGILLATGDNHDGQLGLGDEDDRTTWVDVGISNVKSFYASQMGWLFVLKNDYTLWATGNNSQGQLGLGHTNDVNVLTQVPVTDIKNIYFNLHYIIIEKTDGSLWTAGNNNHGSKGVDGDESIIHTFTEIVGLPNGMDYSLFSYQSTSYILKDNTLYVCGYNAHGELGLGDNVDRKVFNEIIGVSVEEMICNDKWGNDSNYILTTDGRVLVTGKNDRGQLYLGHTDEVNVWTEIPNLDNVKSFKIDYTTSNIYIVKNDNTLWVGGYNQQGSLGLGHNDDVYTITQVTDMLDVKEIIIASYSVIYVMKTDGVLWACGMNNNGQLGIGNYDDSNVFIQTGVFNFKYIHNLGGNYFIITEDNKVYVTGRYTDNMETMLIPGDVNTWTLVDYDFGEIDRIYGIAENNWDTVTFFILTTSGKIFGTWIYPKDIFIDDATDLNHVREVTIEPHDFSTTSNLDININFH